MRFEYLYFEGCPTSKEMLKNVREALDSTGGQELTETELDTLAEGDARLQYGSPTLLIDGKDLMGPAPTTHLGLTCRLFEDGVPSTHQIAQLISDR